MVPQTHKKDYGSRRGLLSILSQRKQLMLYLQVCVNET